MRYALCSEHHFQIAPTKRTDTTFRDDNIRLSPYRYRYLYGCVMGVFGPNYIWGFLFPSRYIVTFMFRLITSSL